MKSGRMYCLDDVLWIKNCKKSHYLLVVNGEEVNNLPPMSHLSGVSEPRFCFILSRHSGHDEPLVL